MLTYFMFDKKKRIKQSAGAISSKTLLSQCSILDHAH
jgi:hypothetical protein